MQQKLLETQWRSSLHVSMQDLALVGDLVEI
jgi:hypothetical protein